MLAHVDNRITYSGNGNATEFAYQFKILDRTDIKVLLTDAEGKEKLLTKDYYVDAEKNVVRYPGYAVGAEVPESERPPVLPTGWKLTIYREVPVTQETDLPDQYPFNQVEAIGDKLTMIAQQLTDVTSRSLKISVSKSTDIDTTIPWENGKSFRISDNGKTLELSEDPAKVLPLAQGVYAQTQAQAQSAAASATAAAKSEDSAFESAGVAGNSAQYASLSAASAAENAELTSGYKQEALTAKADATASATNAKASEANAKTSENNAEASKEAAQSAATTASNFANASRSSANEARTYRDNAKNYSENVNVFTPSVSEDGILSWTNKAGLPNPPSVNIKGKDGADGGVTVDEELSSTSTNPVQNKVIYNALLDKVGNEDIFNGFALRSPTASIMWRTGTQTLGSLTASNYTGTALRATQDGAGNVITDTYTKKADFDKIISDLGVAFQQKADKSDLADVATSGKYTDLLNRPTYVVQSVNNIKPDSNGNVTITVSGGSNVTVDTTLSATSTNPIANKTVYSALEGKLGKTETAYAATKATQDGAGNVIATTYIKTVNNVKPDSNGNVNISGGTGGNITVDSVLSPTSTNAIQNKVVQQEFTSVRAAIPTKVSQLTNDSGYLTQHQSLDGYVKTVNNTAPDSNGNVTIALSGGGGVSTSESNTWTAQQNFHDLMLNREKYATYVVNGTSDTPITSTMVYAVTGAFTLNLATLAGALSASQSSVFTAYFAANADYSLTISNAGKLKYTGSASDVAITTSGLLINIWMSKDGGGTLTSIVQATKLS